MNDAYRTRPFKGINAPELENKVLNTCKKYFEEQSFHNRLTTQTPKSKIITNEKAQTITSNTNNSSKN